MNSTSEARIRRQRRIRKKVFGTPDRPRLSVYKSLNHMYAQIIDDSQGRTIVAISTLGEGFRSEKGHKGNVNTAKKVGEIIGKRALEKGLKTVVFDRGGYPYHGRVKALAEGARKAGLEF